MVDKKKLIGTIIGVTLFGALIVGATFAWLTFGVEIDPNSATTGGTMNFSVAYIRGQDITNMQILGTATPTNVTTITTIKANKVAGSAPGELYLYLNTNEITEEYVQGVSETTLTTQEISDIIAASNALLTSGAIRYAACVGTCNSFTDSSVQTGTINSDSRATLYVGELAAEQTTYNIYFWLDGETVTNDHLGGMYSGFISAEAKQTEN